MTTTYSPRSRRASQSRHQRNTSTFSATLACIQTCVAGDAASLSSSATRVAVGTEMAEPRGDLTDLVVLKELLDMTTTQTRGRSGLSDRQPSLVDGDDRPDPLLLCLRQLRGGRAEPGLHQLCTPDTLW